MDLRLSFLCILANGVEVLFFLDCFSHRVSRLCGFFSGCVLFLFVIGNLILPLNGVGQHGRVANLGKANGALAKTTVDARNRYSKRFNKYLTKTKRESKSIRFLNYSNWEGNFTNLVSEFVRVCFPFAPQHQNSKEQIHLI